MSAVVTVQRQNTPRSHAATSDPTTSSDTAAGFRVGDIWFNTATGNIWKCYDATAGAAKWRHEPRILGQSGAAASNAADTNELALATVTIAAGALGTNGAIRVVSTWAFTNSANNKTLRVRLGGISGTAFLSVVRTTSDNHYDIRTITNRGAANSQVSQGAGTNFGGFTGGLVTGTIDTSSATTLVITGQKASSGETLTLESYLVELLRPDIT